MPSPARLASLRKAESGQVILLLLIVIAVIGGGYWFMKKNRDARDAEARAFATEAVHRIVLQRDQRFIDSNMTQKAQMTYPPSWRARLLEFIRAAGTPNPEWHFTKSEVLFTSEFFEPQGVFVAQFDYPNGPGYFEVHISHPGAFWVIDDLNWTWQPQAPTPAPTVAPIATASPIPTATATPPRKAKKG
ncbi:MAG: hypothetical protein M3032_01420 [Verrucomicrobiota bacterium]|nr:hypothetical protein [Verrucomicrobiota bacterium]